MRICFLFIPLFLAGCGLREQDRKVLRPGEDLFMHYKITGEEDKETVTCLVQFKEGGVEGEGQLLPEKEKIELDGEPLIPDSARISGAYYELDKPIEGFAGQHTLVFTGLNNKKYEEEFEFLPFSISDLPHAVPRKTFTLHLEDLSGNPARLRIVLTDTAFLSNDVTELVTVHNGELPITDSMLSRLSSGPIFMELFHEVERPLKQKGRGGGTILISFGLRRSFLLED